MEPYSQEVAQEMRDLLVEVYDQLECFDVRKHNSGMCLCKRVQAVISRTEEAACLIKRYRRG